MKGEPSNSVFFGRMHDLTETIISATLLQMGPTDCMAGRKAPMAFHTFLPLSLRPLLFARDSNCCRQRGLMVTHTQKERKKDTFCICMYTLKAHLDYMTHPCDIAHMTV